MFDSLYAKTIDHLQILDALNHIPKLEKPLKIMYLMSL